MANIISSRMRFIVAVFLILNCSITIKSDHIEDDCREVQCPLPELECPPDSELKSSASGNLDEEDEYGDSNPFDRLEADGKIEELIFPATTNLPHVLQKRSLQHRRREAIKIVPGDYRSFEPEFFKYHNHHQPHRKWKRDLVMMAVQPNSEDEIKKCCPEFQCVCRTCKNPPKCQKGHVAIVVGVPEQSHGLPGSCCPKYKCVPEMECSIASQPKASYWRSECLKCDCFGGHELCKQLCEVNEDQSALNCFSAYLNRPKMNGDTWLEDDDCMICKCVNGDNHCQASYCSPLDCENPIKVEGKCCKVCPETSATTSTTLSTTTISKEDHEMTTEPPVTTTTLLPAETSTSTSTPSSTTAPVTTMTSKVDQDFEPTSILPSTTAPTDIFTEHSPDISHMLQKIDIIVVLIVASAILVIFLIGIGFVVNQRQKKKKLVYSTIPSSESNSQSSSITLA